MSHQSGISVGKQLRDDFAAAQSGSVRYVIAKIEGESVVTVKSAPGGGGDWKQDLNKVSADMTETDARYVMVNNGESWILISYVPDKCPVKDKMLYASTLSTVKRQLGANFFSDEFHGTVPEDVNAEGYEAHLAHVAADVPLTNAEYARQEELEAGEIYTGGSSTYVHGVAFPAEGGVMPALKGLVSGTKNYVALGVNTTKEVITLTDNDNITIEKLSDKVSLKTPQFHFLRYKHESYDEIIFVFTCPDGSGNTTACPIKERMLYSSSKARAVSLLEEAGGKVEKMFEFNEPADIVKEDIDNALHPPKAEAKQVYKRPTRPGRGARKLIRSNK